MEIETEVELTCKCPKCGEEFIENQRVIVDIEPPDRDEL